jgi:hypothetical protein
MLESLSIVELTFLTDNICIASSATTSLPELYMLVIRTKAFVFTKILLVLFAEHENILVEAFDRGGRMNLLVITMTHPSFP